MPYISLPEQDPNFVSIASPVQHDLLSNKPVYQYPAAHQIDRYGEIVGGVQISNGQIVQPAPSTLITRKLFQQHVTIGATGKEPLKTTAYFCDSVQIQSVRSDMTDNVGRIGIGSVAGWGNVIEPQGGVLAIDSPVNGVLDLSTVFIYGTPGDEVSILILE